MENKWTLKIHLDRILQALNTAIVVILISMVSTPYVGMLSSIFIAGTAAFGNWIEQGKINNKQTVIAMLAGGLAGALGYGFFFAW